MSENRELIRVTSLKGLVGTNVDGDNPFSGYASIIAEIASKCGADVATLFAEPVTSDRGDPSNREVTWYTRLDGQIVSLQSLDEVARRPVVETLRARLRKLQPLLQDPRLGPVIASWLYIPTSEDILAIGGSPVLINWGHVSEAVANSSARREAHFSETIGRFDRELAVPPFTSEEAITYAGRLERKNQAAASAAAIPAGVPAADAAVSPPISVRPRAGWRAPLIACILAAAVLAFLLLPGVLLRPDTTTTVAQNQLNLKLLREGNDTLEEKLRKLQNDTKDRVCVAPNGSLVPLAPLPGQPAPTAPPRAETNPPSDRIQLPSSPLALNQLIEKSVVMVFGPGKDPRSMGSGTGFFINDNQIVTNRHVIEGLPPDKIWVVSRQLRVAGAPIKAYQATIVAQSDNSTAGDYELGSIQDFAVLSIEDPPPHEKLQIGGSPAKATDVQSIGYPGFIVSSDPSYQAILSAVADMFDGARPTRPFVDPAAAPDSNQERGYITSKQDDFPVKILVHSARIAQGNSGGPLLDLCGRVVGVNTQVRSARGVSTSTNFAQEAPELKQFLTRKSIVAQYDEAERTCPVAVAAAQPPPAAAPTPPGGAPSGATPAPSATPAPAAPGRPPAAPAK